LGLSVARAGDDLFDLPLAVIGVRQARMLPDDISTILDDDDLLLIMDAPAGSTGAVSVSLPLVSALIQQQTLGQVLANPPDARPFTDTDAAMCAPLVDAVLSRAHGLAEAEVDQTCFRAIRFGARGEEARSVLLALRARRYRVFWLTLDIALGKRQAEMILILPDETEEKPDPAASSQNTAERVATSPMLDIPAEVQAVLTRFRLTVAQLNALKIGDVLPVQKESLAETMLVGPTGRVVGRGRLGQMNGSRALRLTGHVPIPRAHGAQSNASFDPSAMPAPVVEELPGMEPDMPLDLTFDEADDLSLENLSADEAASQISELAGFDAVDLNPDETLQGQVPNLPATLGDLS